MNHISKLVRTSTIVRISIVLLLAALAFSSIGEASAASFEEQQKLTATGGLANDRFGISIGVAGDTAVVGASGKDFGAAYVFTRSGTIWTQQSTLLTASDGAANDSFGAQLAVSGDTAVFGAVADDDACLPIINPDCNSGSVYVFTRSGTTWTQIAKLTADDAATLDLFGDALAVSVDTVVVGARGDDDAGAESGSAYVFERNQGGPDNWGQVKKLTAGDAATDDNFGNSVAVSADTVVVGAFRDGGNSNFGSAYIFERNQGGTDNWGQVKKLTNPDAAIGDKFGNSIAISGDTVVVGVRRDDGPGNDSGSAYVFERDKDGAENWGEVKKLTASDAAAGDNFGASVAVSGDTAVVGALGDDSFTGSTYLFKRDEGGPQNWGQTNKLTASDAAAGDSFGASVAILGDTVAIGAFGNEDAGNNTGSAYIFTPPAGPPKLTVTKVVVNNDGGTKTVSNFSLFVDGGSVISGVENTFSAGAHTVSETPLTGYEGTISGDCAGDGTITLALGDVKSCTITNADIAPKLTVSKVVVNDDGGTLEFGDFSLFVDGGSVTSGVENTFSAGAHTVSETPVTGYEGTISGACAANGTITLALGDVKSCTITNADIAPKLTVTKVVVNNDGGTLGFGDFSLFVDGGSVISGVENTFSPGAHTVSETSVPSYEGTISGACAANGTITLAIGDVKSCTITNDDIAIADIDTDGDGVADIVDNAPNVFNPDQSDIDGDGVGDVADSCPSDPTNTCDPSGSAAASIGSGGGTLTSPDGSVFIDVPAGALTSDTTISVTNDPSIFELSTNLGQAVAVFGVDIQPTGTNFAVPITIVFAWDDVDNDGIVDGTNIKEDRLLISQDNVAITGKCSVEPDCDTVANTFEFTVSTLSIFAPVAPVDTDLDGVADNFGVEIDNCPTVPNPDQADAENDGVGDACSSYDVGVAGGGFRTKGRVNLSRCEPCPVDVHIKVKNFSDHEEFISYTVTASPGNIVAIGSGCSGELGPVPASGSRTAKAVDIIGAPLCQLVYGYQTGTVELKLTVSHTGPPDLDPSNDTKIKTVKVVR